jgi:predicted O-linked N-acetylglucosamine transferase (SPINDLY family)
MMLAHDPAAGPGESQVPPSSAAQPANLAGLGLPELLALTEKATQLGDSGLVIRIYQQWIMANGPEHPRTAPGWFNLGVQFVAAGDNDRALTCYQSALAARPDLYAAAVNLGLMLERAGNLSEARAVWLRALQPTEARTSLLNNIGRLEESSGALEDAERDLRTSLLADPTQADVIQHYVHIRQKLCRWPVLAANLPELPPEKLIAGCGPLAVLAMTDDVATQREVTKGWINHKSTPAPASLAPADGYRHERIRIGYMSSDFCRHAMSYLVAELFERHDRSQFEVFGYCSSREDGSAIRSRIIGAFDKFTIIRDLPDAEAAQIIRNDEIDILVDLNGLTAGARVQVLRSRPAPVQATYLGFIGPVSLPELDYFLCDDFTVPPEQAAEYFPKPLPVGKLYQANDTHLAIGPAAHRSDIGLPEDRFVFCSLTNHYKITPEVFAAWMEILHAVPNSVLWLADDGTESKKSLYAHTAAAGVDPARLIITPRAEPSQYLARMRLADLYLDTFPYNAGTVASDAIRMQLPIVTRTGRSFASRMAASLLRSVGALEGITDNIESYVATAIHFATNPTAFAAYKARFTDEAWLAGPGDIVGFTQGLEQALKSVVKSPQA